MRFCFGGGGCLKERQKMKKIFLVLLMCFFGFGLAFAEEEKDEKPSIFGKTLDEALSPFEMLITPSKRLDPIVVTPTRYEDSSLDTSKDVTVITAKDIERAHDKYVPDLLRNEAGIVVSDIIGNGKTLRVDIRGFGDSAPQNVLVMIDGRRTNQIDLSGADWTQIDIDSIERIEITRGPQTVLYGDNATGGVVNIITKSGKGKKPEAGVKYETGSFRYNAVKAHIEGGSKFMDYYGMIATTYNNGYRINSSLETIDYNAKIALKPTDFLKLRLTAGYHRDWYGLPGAVKPVDINGIGTRGSINPRDRARTQDYYFMFTPELKHDFGFGETFFTVDLITRGRRTNSDMPMWDMSHADHIKTFGVTPRVAFTTNLFGINNRIMAGLDYYTNKDEIHDGWLPAMNTIIIHKDTVGLYLHDTVELPFSLVANGGFRSEWAYYTIDQQAQLVGNYRKEPFEYAFDAGLVYKYNPKSSLYTTVSRSFRFPVVDEWYQAMYTSWTGRVAGGLNLDLKPQTAMNYEIGIKENSSKYVGLAANYYIMDVKNELYLESLVNSQKNSIYPHTIHQGLEVKGDLYLFDNLIHGFANYTYEKTFFVEGTFAGSEMPLVPKNKFSAGFDLFYKDCFYFTYFATYVGSRYIGNDLKNINPKLKPYTRHDIKISYKKYGLEIFATINNLTNAEYSEFGVLDRAQTSPGYYPSPRRTFLIGFSYKI